jgi:hypothetical protein
LRDESIGDSTLIEDLEGARVQTAGARAGERLALPSCSVTATPPLSFLLSMKQQTNT